MKDVTPEELDEFHRMLATGSKAEHSAYDARLAARKVTQDLNEVLARWTRATEALTGTDGKNLVAATDAGRDLLFGVNQIHSSMARMYRAAEQADQAHREGQTP